MGSIRINPDRSHGEANQVKKIVKSVTVVWEASKARGNTIDELVALKPKF
jgi:hypothetical protein